MIIMIIAYSNDSTIWSRHGIFTLAFNNVCKKELTLAV